MTRWDHRFCIVWSAIAICSLSINDARADDWPQWMGPQRDGVWREGGIVKTFPEEGLKPRWRTPIGGGYAGPAVANGRVYVTDRISNPAPPGPATEPGAPRRGGAAPEKGTGIERVLCLNEADGRILWKHEYECRYGISYPAGPRTTPAVADGKVYTLGAEGDLFCFNAETGGIIWSRQLKKDYERAGAPVWGFASNPLIDGNKLIVFVGGTGCTVVALDKETGKEIWRAIDSPAAQHGPGYSSPVIFEAGGRRQLIAWHPSAVSSLDPETGKIFWEQPFRCQSGLSLATPRKLDDQLFISAFYNGSMMMRFDPDKPTASAVWQRHGKSERDTDALHCLIGTPWLQKGYVYGVDSYGALRCLNAENGERVWSTAQPTKTKEMGPDRWTTAFIVKHEDRFFLFNDLGDLIIANLSPKGYEELSRAKIIEPTNRMTPRLIVWTHPAFANKSVYVRNDREILCVSLAAGGK